MTRWFLLNKFSGSSPFLSFLQRDGWRLQLVLRRTWYRFLGWLSLKLWREGCLGRWRFSLRGWRGDFWVFCWLGAEWRHLYPIHPTLLLQTSLYVSFHLGQFPLQPMTSSPPIFPLLNPISPPIASFSLGLPFLYSSAHWKCIPLSSRTKLDR